MNYAVRLVAIFAILVCLLSSSGAQNTSSNVAAVRHFVQSFYDWYTPIASGDTKVDSEALALRTKRSLFTPELLEALIRDQAAQAKVPGDIVGLDFDPFMNSQDPDKRYVVGKIARKGHVLLVELRPVLEGGETGPDVIVKAEVAEKRGQYRFSNFIYPPGGDNLLHILKQLAKDRRGK